VAEIAVLLKALTPEARTALGGIYYKIARFPFRVGRESRLTNRSSVKESRRRADSMPNNDLYLVEPGALLNVSREHFLIDARGGNYVLVDRGSMCGTLVEGELVGEKKKGGWRQLSNNDVIVVGTSESKFIFKFVVVENA
jgi:pSer/pThr/pTyr-binding forkhead associated (FHA) protein